MASPPSAEPGASSPPTEVEDAIRRRRTSLLVDAEVPVPAELVDRLLAAATWAPNHKRTWPWRFTVLTGAARARLGAAMAARAAAAGADDAKVAKLGAKYLRSAAVVLVWVARGHTTDEVRRREDRDAVAASVQNLLLAATANGLGSYWGTVSDHLEPAVREVAGLDDDHDLVALVYLGWPTATVPAPERPAPSVTWLT